MAQIILPEAGRPYVTIQADGESCPLDVDPEAITAFYKNHGALLFRGFQTGLDDFRRFTDQFCVSSVFNESPDRRLLDEVHNIQSVNGGLASFPLHPELSREPWKPDICFFCCLTPPREQGATTICDGVEIVRQLPLPIRQGLASRRLLYVQPAPPELLKFWLGTSTPTPAELNAPPSGCPYRFARMGDQIVRHFSRPALHKPMFNDSPAFGNFLLFAKYFIGLPAFPVFENGAPVPEAWLKTIKDIGDGLSAAIAWKKGDLLMLDNTRFMHGRTAIADADERLIASYFGYLRFALPNPEEPADPPWRKAMFRPPMRKMPTTAPA